MGAAGFSEYCNIVKQENGKVEYIKMGRITRSMETIQPSCPLYVEALELNLYSKEELSYFLQKFLYLTDEAFFNSDLLRFLREELKRPDLSERVLSGIERRENPVLLAGELGLALGELSEAEKGQIKKEMAQYQKLSADGKKKAQADLLYKNKKYEKAEKIYQELVKEQEQGKSKLTETQMGEICYHMGRIYLLFFDWKPAGAALLQACRFSGSEEILHQLYELSCISPVPVCDPEIFEQVHGVTLRRWQTQFQQKKKRLEEEAHNVFQNSGKEGVPQPEAAKKQGQNSESQSPLDREIYEKWKNDFRKIRKSCCQGDIFSV